MNMCVCKTWIDRMEGGPIAEEGLYSAMVKFNCPEHGEITIDKRAVHIDQRPPAYHSPSPQPRTNPRLPRRSVG